MVDLGTSNIEHPMGKMPPGARVGIGWKLFDEEELARGERSRCGRLRSRLI